MCSQANRTLAILALDRAYEALCAAAAELTLAAALARTDGTLGPDTVILARAIEVETLAVHDVIRRHS
jgi:hypothetical protein